MSGAGESRRGRAGRRSGEAPRRDGETLKRVLFALPWVAFAILIVVLGGPFFALAMVLLGGLCMRELFATTHDRHPAQLPAYLSLLALCTAAYFGGSYQVLLIFTASLPVIFLMALAQRKREVLLGSIMLGLLASAWIGLPMAHAIFLRELPDHGAALLVNVLVGTFVADTAAYATGRMFGHRRIFPRLSPNKTLEGLIGGFLIGALSVWFAGLYQDWFSGIDALILGCAVAAAAPVGDLFESGLKRDLGVKDTGRIFGPHGGLLDRLDAALFTVVVGYYVSVALVY